MEGRLSGNASRALPTLQASLDLNSSCARRRFFLGALHRTLGHKAEAVESWRAAIAANATYEDPYIQLVSHFENEADFEAARLVARQAVEAGACWMDEWQRPGFALRGLESRAWWRADEFPWAARLEAAAADIRGELLAFRAARGLWSPVGNLGVDAHDARLVSAGGAWGYVRLFDDAGNAAEGAARAFPRTTAHLEEILPEAADLARSGLGEVLLTAVTPGTRVAPHCATNNFLLTCHLGLICPPGARIRVGSEPWRSWAEGQCLFFDDSYEHELENTGESERVVLLLRFWHPGFPEELKHGAPMLQKLAEDELYRGIWIPPMSDARRDKAVRLLSRASRNASTPREALLMADLLGVGEPRWPLWPSWLGFLGGGLLAARLPGAWGPGPLSVLMYLGARPATRGRPWRALQALAFLAAGFFAGRPPGAESLGQAVAWGPLAAGVALALGVARRRLWKAS